MANKKFIKQKEIALLYVEDEVLLRERFAEFFKFRFENCYFAENGKLGLELFLKHRPDIIVTDIRMPIMDGLEMATKIRELYTDIPIIITSTFNEQEYLHKAIDLGIARYVLKPIKRDKLEEALLESIEVIQLRRERTKQEQKIHEILDSQNSILILTDGKIIDHVNKAFLDFLHFKDIQDFKDKHSCICEFFLQKKGFIYKTEDKHWLFQVLQQEYSKVIMLDHQQEEHVFQVKANQFSLDQENYVVSFTDITLEYNYQKILEKRVSEETEKRVERERVLLHQARLALMGEMIGSIAHQLKQPLFSLSIISNLLRQNNENKDNETVELLEEMDRQVNYMSETISTFRNFLKPHQEDEYFDLFSIIKSVFRLTEKMLLENNLEYQIVYGNNQIANDVNTIGKLQGAFAAINGNGNEFKQVLMNLIVNSRDAVNSFNKDLHYTKRIKGKIIITTLFSKKTITLQYEDNGGGIPEAILANLFQPYQTTKGEAGTGIGLYMIKQIIDKMHGNITIENKDKGALFTITLHLVNHE